MQTKYNGWSLDGSRMRTVENSQKDITEKRG